MTRLFNITLAMAVIFATSAVTSSAFADPSVKSEPTQVPVTFSKIYVPVGFDSNDHVQFVGEGMFSNSCYRPAATTVTTDATTKTITVSPVAYVYNGLCLQVILPFERVVDVGILAAGTWQVVQIDGKKIGEISVKPTLSPEPDDYLYAPISQAYVRQSGSRTNLYLNGIFPNKCMSIQDVKVTNSDDAIMVQPIAVNDANCKDATPTSFTKVVKLPMLKAGRYLLHVRSMNGNAVNTLVDLQ